MKSFFKLIVFLLISLLIAPVADAASPYGNRSTDLPTEVYLPPAVFVPTVSLDSPTTRVGATLQGEFTVFNREERFIGDLTYRIQLLGALEGSEEVVADTAPEYDQAKSSAAFSLAPDEKTVVPFTYVIPQVPSGSYRLRIQLTTKEFRDLGWRDANVTIEGESSSFALLTANSLSVAEYPDQTLSPKSGPNINRGGTFSLLATAKNTSDSETTFTPVVVISQPNNPEAGPVTVKGDAVTLGAQEEKALSLRLTALSTPAIYRGELMLLTGDDQHRASTIASYQWIVRGVSGHIVSASLDQSTFQAGDTAVATITYSGSADAETTFKGVVTVQLEDHEGVLASASSPSDLDLTDALQTARAELKLDRTPTSDVQLVVKLSDTRGNLLDDYAVVFPLEQLTSHAASFTRQQLLLIAAILAVALIILITIAIRRRRGPSAGSRSMASMTTMAALLLVMGGAIQLAWAAGNGNGINILNPSIVQPGGHWTAVAGRPSIELFINDPIHNMPGGTYDRTKVPLSYRVQWAVCGNDWAYARVITSYLNKDMAYSGFQPPTGAAWVQVSNNLWGDAFGCAGSCSYIAARNFTAPNGINLTQLPADAAQATLRIMALRGKDSESIPQWNEGPDAYTHFGGYYGEHVVNLWLNFKKAATTPPPTSPVDCPAGSPEVTVPGTNENGVVYTHTGTNGTYRIEVISPTGLSDSQYSNYTWANWPTDDRARHHGSSLFIVKNAALQFGPDTDPTTQSLGGQRVSNVTARLDSLLLDPPYNQSRSQVANAARGLDTTLDLVTGDSLRLVVNAIKGVGTNQGSYTQNQGAVHLRICPVNPTSPTSSPTVTPGPDLNVTISAPETVEKSALLNYSLNVKNLGSESAAQVKVTVPIPTGLTFHAASSSGGCSKVGTNIECSLGTVTGGQSTPLAVVFTVGEGVTCNSNLSTTATVSTTSTDIDSGNNTATSNTTKVTCGECRDAIDNDGDDKVDSDDPACHENYDINQPYNPNRPSEKDTQCTDGDDNDGDDLVDVNDPGCHVGNDISKEYVPADNTESGAAPFDPGGFKVVE